MKLGILGTGMIVKDLLSTIDQLNIEKIYLLATEATKEEAEQLCKDYHLAGYVTDYDTLLDMDIDTIYVALPNHLHYSFAKQALMRDKHVIIEKPVTSNARELKSLLAISRERKKIMVEAMSIHYLPAFLSLKEKIASLGQIKIVSFNYSQYSSRYDAFKQGHILPAFDYRKSGGALMDLNVYNLHAIVALFGRPKAVQYLANVENKIDTSGIMVLDYGSFKAVAIGAKDCKAPVMSTIQGDKGNIVMKMPVNGLRAYQLSDNAGHEQTLSFDDQTHRLFYEFKAFIEIIEQLDFVKAEKMLETSLIVSEVMEEGRKQQGIIFSADEEKKQTA